MLVVKVSGGLGNQMFQYAFGKALSLYHQLPVAYDLSFYRHENANVTARSYELDVFETSVHEADIGSFKIMPPPNSLIKRWQLAFDSIRGKRNLIRINESDYKPSISTAFLQKFDLYFNGYWQNEKYFKFCNEEIRRDFTLNPEVISSSETVKTNVTDIQRRNSVSIHFRRGDYITDPKTAQHHGICSVAYYENAVKYIAQRVDTPYFYIFSDDPTWVKENFSLTHEHHIMDHREQTSSVIDMYLMSLCKHHVIANSTFSWWGAWLNKYPQKLVIAPQRWFADAVRNDQKKDIVPPHWIRLS